LNDEYPVKNIQLLLKGKIPDSRYIEYTFNGRQV